MLSVFLFVLLFLTFQLRQPVCSQPSQDGSNLWGGGGVGGGRCRAGQGNAAQKGQGKAVK